MSTTVQDKTATYGKIIARAWRGQAFKTRLIADPQAVLREAGVDLPAGVTVTVVENTDKQFHFVLPPRPPGELADETLERLAGGSTCVRF